MSSNTPSADAGGNGPAPRRSSRIRIPSKQEAAATEKTLKRMAIDDANNARKAKKVKSEKQLVADDVGDKPTPLVLPSMTLKNEREDDVDVSALAAKAERGIVLFLVPRADTPGCTNQACGFRDIHEDFEKAGFHVYCLSADKPTAQAKWQAKKALPFSLLSDPSRVLIRALGADKGGKTARSHFVFARDGKLLDRKMPVKPVDSPRLALEFICGLTKEAADIVEGADAGVAVAVGTQEDTKGAAISSAPEGDGGSAQGSASNAP